MKYVLCSIRKGNKNKMMEKKWLCEILHIAGVLNSKNPIQIQTETFIKHVLPAKVRALHVCQRVNKIKNTTSIIQQSINTTLPKESGHHLEFKIQISSLDSMFLASFPDEKMFVCQ